mmetsp:Transcript_72479/g.224001  ORF Transcript_72479/g.224001 Transcript_72479/m.224001 type:complete len:375 (+) Transcript_72479:261-1385(+)
MVLVERVANLPVEDVQAPAADAVLQEEHVEVLDGLRQGPGDGDDALVAAVVAIKVEGQLADLLRQALRQGSGARLTHLHAREGEREHLHVLRQGRRNGLHALQADVVVRQVQLQDLRVLRDLRCESLGAVGPATVAGEVELDGLEVLAQRLGEGLHARLAKHPVAGVHEDGLRAGADLAHPEELAGLGEVPLLAGGDELVGLLRVQDAIARLLAHAAEAHALGILQPHDGEAVVRDLPVDAEVPQLDHLPRGEVRVEALAAGQQQLHAVVPLVDERIPVHVVRREGHHRILHTLCRGLEAVLGHDRLLDLQQEGRLLLGGLGLLALLHQLGVGVHLLLDVLLGVSIDQVVLQGDRLVHGQLHLAAGLPGEGRWG